MLSSVLLKIFIEISFISEDIKKISSKINQVGSIESSYTNGHRK